VFDAAALDQNFALIAAGDVRHGEQDLQRIALLAA
jgi:hypothetical protein